MIYRWSKSGPKVVIFGPLLDHFWTPFFPKSIDMVPCLIQKVVQKCDQICPNLSKSGQILPKTVFFVFSKTAKTAQTVKNPKKRVFLSGKNAKLPKNSKKITKIPKNAQKSKIIQHLKNRVRFFDPREHKNSPLFETKHN